MSALGRHQPSERCLRLELERSPEAPSVARAAINGFSSDLELGAAEVATLTLLVSEVVTNAVVHPDAEESTNITLTARRSKGTVRIEVTDQGSGFTPTARDPAQLAGGYGLFLLERQATRWGVEQRRGTSVWFELATRTT
jgi:anti-sigma regulatory factor (Ser/Thr protein kinase)